MRIAIIGAGSIGCYVGGRLAAAGEDVVFVGRQRMGDTLARHGMTCVEGSKEPARVAAGEVVFSTEMNAAEGAEVALLCVKSGGTQEAAAALSQVLSPGARILSLQNGLRNADVIRAEVGERKVIPTIVEFNVVTKEDGVFHCGMSGAIVMEDEEPALVAALRKAGIDVTIVPDLVPHQWTKLIVNLNNAISALSGAPTTSLLGEAGFRHIIAALIDEALVVTRRAKIRPASLRGVPLWLMPKVLRSPSWLVRLITSRQVSVDPEARSSMWEDLNKRRNTEVAFLNGEIVALAQRVGASAPINARIVKLIGEAEERREGSPGLSAGELKAALGVA